MNTDKVRSTGNGAASETPGSESLDKAPKQRATNQKSGNRRTRGLAAANRGLPAMAGNAPTKRSNGRPSCASEPATAGKYGRNGRGHASLPNGAVNMPHQSATADKQGSTASVDAAGDSDARAAVTPAASTDRAACAEVALTLNGGKQPGQNEAVSRASGTQPRPDLAGPRVSGDDEGSAETPKERLPGGDAPLPDDIADFVDEVHSRVDLFEVLTDLLNSKDDKIKQRAVERILEMKYKHAAGGEDPVQIILDGPRPQHG